MPATSPATAPRMRGPKRSSMTPRKGPETPATARRTVNPQERAAKLQPRSSRMGVTKKENTAAFMGEEAVFMSRATATMTQP